MPERTFAGATTSELGILGGPRREYQLIRMHPASDLAHLVERHWLVTWDLPAGRRSSTTHLPHPCVNLVFDGGRLAVAGVGREVFRYPLAGRGRAFGVKFRPGGFRPLLGSPVADLTDRVVPLAAMWGQEVAEVERAMAAATTPGELVQGIEPFLRQRLPEPDPAVEMVGRIVRVLLTDRSVSRVDDVARSFGISPRSLQRTFRDYVGVSPKWVLRRYRLHEAAARLAEGTSGSWAAVAAELGYSDQSHFIRDFTRAVGLTPGAYAAECLACRAPLAV